MASCPRMAEPDALKGFRSKDTGQASDGELLRRFVEQRDEAAIATLVQRYGPMVMGLCQRILHQREDAEDAFQATFLVLVQKASTLRRPELLGNWLYGVAYRIARKAKSLEARRLHKEKTAMSIAASKDPATEAEWRDLLSVVDEELQQLPDKYRLPLVLCYLGNMTNEEAAERLGWPAGSISYRLSRAREMLQHRLQKRQLSLPSGFFAGMAVPLALPTVSGDLIGATVSLAMKLKAATAAVVVPSTPAVQLARCALHTMAGEKKRITLLQTIVVLVAALGLAILFVQFLAGGFAPRSFSFETGGTGGMAPSCVPQCVP